MRWTRAPTGKENYMLTERQIRNKLYEYAEQFRGAYQRKEWARAKSLYITAQRTAVFLELQERDLAELFGNRAYKDEREELVDGLFPEYEVERASWECIRIHKTYDDLHIRPRDGRDRFVASWREIGGGRVLVQLEEVGT